MRDLERVLFQAGGIALLQRLRNPLVRALPTLGQGYTVECLTDQGMREL